MNPFSEPVKKEADEYISTCWPRGIPPHQAIEIKLAFYAGMIAMSDMMLKAPMKSTTEEEGVEAVENLIQAVVARAMRLNQEKRPQ